MASEWYYAKGDEKFGPVTDAELTSIAQSGELSPDDLVWNDGMPEWMPVGKIDGLLPKQSKSKPPPLPLSSETCQTATPDTGTGTSPNAATPQNTMAAAWSSFVSTAKATAQLAAKQAEKTKLTTITLPAAYRPLGKYCHESQQYRAEFSDLFQQLDAIKTKLAAITAKQNEKPSTPQSVTDRAKATAGNAMQAAQSQKLSMQQSSLFSTLGKAVYEKHANQSGPASVTAPIAGSLARLAAVDSDIARHSSAGKGSWITPKRLAIAGGLAACLLVVVGTGKLIPFRATASANRTDNEENRPPQASQPTETTGTSSATTANRTDLQSNAKAQGGIAEGAINRFRTDALRITAYVAWALEVTVSENPRPASRGGAAG